MEEGYERYQFREENSELGGVEQVPEYPPICQFFSIRFHYGGCYFEEPCTVYVGGEVKIADYIHPRNLHVKRLDATAQYVGHGSNCFCWYKKPDKLTNGGMEVMCWDGDIADMARIGARDRVLEIYLLADRVNFLPWRDSKGLEIQDNGQKKMLDGGKKQKKPVCRKNENVPKLDKYQQDKARGFRQMRRRLLFRGQWVHPLKRQSPVLKLNQDEDGVYLLDDEDEKGEKPEIIDDAGPVEAPSQSTIDTLSGPVNGVSEVQQAKAEFIGNVNHGDSTQNGVSEVQQAKAEMTSSRKRKVEELLEKEVEEDSAEYSETDSEWEPGDEEDEKFHDSDYEVSEDNEVAPFLSDRRDEWKKVARYSEQGTGNDSDDSDPEWVEPGDDIDSDGLHSQTSSDSDDDDVGKRKVRVLQHFVQPSPNEDATFELNQHFTSRAEFQNACRHHGSLQHRRIRIKRSNSKRCTAICMGSEKCRWKVSVNYRAASKSWEVTSLMLNHKCTPSFNHACSSSRYLSRRYKEDIKIMPNIKSAQLVDMVRKDLHVTISRFKAFTVKRRAVENIEGDMKEQYGMLRDYCLELRKQNPNSTVLLQTERNAAGRELFHRIYVCFDACKRGFVEGCRPLLGVDGCHLSGPHKGILLAAVGLDANDQIYPVAYAIVEIENKISWLWFLTALKNDLNIKNTKEWTILSDKQKGLGSAMKTILAGAEHRLCTWHMYKNFRDASHRGVELKEMVWAAAKSTHERQFARHMERIKKASPSAHAWLVRNTNPKEWSRAYFNTESKCDILVNNIVECFNKVILAARDKPIMTALETLRVYYMERLQKKRIFLAKMHGEFGPKVQQKLEKNMQQSNHFAALHSVDMVYEVQGFHGGQYKVDLQQRTCGCRRWQLTGLPCAHAIAAINMTREEPKAFVDAYYSKEWYEKSYKYAISPINGPEFWEKADGAPLLPPRLVRMPGRPEKSRKKDAFEKIDMKIKSNKKGETQSASRVGKMRPYKCRLCNETGHNSIRCPSKKAGFEKNTSNVAQTPSSIPQPAGKCCPPPEVSPSADQGSTSSQKKRRGCTLCNGFGHYRTTCPASVAGKKFRPEVDYSELRGDKWPDQH